MIVPVERGSYMRGQVLNLPQMLAATATMTGETRLFEASVLRGPARGLEHTSRGSLVAAWQSIFESNLSEDIVAYMHDDVEVFDQGWAEKVMAEFDRDESLAILGFGGATGMGSEDIYKVPYHIQQMARVDYKSNQRDWETHGGHETGVRKVAVVDGFFMAVRTKFLREVGGWKWIRSNFHCYDTAMSLMALRRGWTVKTIGIDCVHHGGGTSTKAVYAEWCREYGTTPAREHEGPHRWQYEEFRDVLPVRIGGE